MFGASILLLLVWTGLESAFVGMSAVAERIVTFALLVLPAGTGAVFGLRSLRSEDGQRWLAVMGLTLNTLFAAFHLLIVLFAG